MHYGALLHTSGGAPWFLKNNLYLEFIMIENKNNTPRRPTAQTVSAFMMLLAGIALNFCSFFTPPRGELTESFYGRGTYLCCLGVWTDGLC